MTKLWQGKKCYEQTDGEKDGQSYDGDHNIIQHVWCIKREYK